jgi:hypothetical protein
MQEESRGQREWEWTDKQGEIVHAVANPDVRSNQLQDLRLPELSPASR